MSIEERVKEERVNRRDFLTLLALAVLLAPARLASEPVTRRGTFAADVGILYQMLTFQLKGDVQESVDRAGGRYHVTVSGQGDGIANRVESSGVLRGGRWVPLRGASWFQVRGRESRTQVTYDYERHAIEYHGRGETFFRRRLRVVDDVVRCPRTCPSTTRSVGCSTIGEGLWTPRPDGRLHTHVVRRRRAENEGPDDVAQSYRAEVIPLELRSNLSPTRASRLRCWISVGFPRGRARTGRRASCSTTNDGRR